MTSTIQCSCNCNIVNIYWDFLMYKNLLAFELVIVTHKYSTRNGLSMCVMHSNS